MLTPTRQTWGAAQMIFFEFNQYSAPLLIGLLQGLVFAALLLRRAWHKDRLSDRLMAILLLLCCAHLGQYTFGFGGWYDSHDWRSSLMFYFPFHHYLLLGPVLYFYFRSLTNPNFQFSRPHLWHFVPGLLWIFFFLLSFVFDVVLWHWLQGWALPLHFGTKGFWGDFMQGPIRDVFNISGLLSFYVYLIFTFGLYRRYRQYIINNFSDTEHIRHNWLRNILYVLIVGLTIQWLYMVASIFFDFSYTEYWTSYLAIAAMTYVVSIAAYISTDHIPPQLAFEPLQPEPEPLPIDDVFPELDQWRTRLQKHLEEKRPYLDPNLTLGELAKQLRTNTSVLSKVINQGFGQNFNDLINSYRVAAVEERLKKGDHQQLTLLSIAFDCGFNSKATFNRAFRKFRGKSPREML